MADSAPDLDAAEWQESGFATRDLQSSDSGVTHRRYRPGKRQGFAPRHQRAEEFYVVLSGSGRVKLDENILELEPLDAFRVAPEVLRAWKAGPDGLEMLAFWRTCRGRRGARPVRRRARSRLVDRLNGSHGRRGRCCAEAGVMGFAWRRRTASCPSSPRQRRGHHSGCELESTFGTSASLSLCPESRQCRRRDYMTPFGPEPDANVTRRPASPLATRSDASASSSCAGTALAPSTDPPHFRTRDGDPV